MLVFIATKGEVSVWRALVPYVCEHRRSLSAGGSLQQCLVLVFLLEALRASSACSVKETDTGSSGLSPNPDARFSVVFFHLCFEISVFFLLVHKLFLNL